MDKNRNQINFSVGEKKPAKAGLFQHENHAINWCPNPDSNWDTHKARDFKSLVSTDSTIRADKIYLSVILSIWRREPDSNRRTRSCSPLHSLSTIAPSLLQFENGFHQKQLFKLKFN